MPKMLSDKNNKNIIINNNVLKLHINDRRFEILEKYKEMCS